MALNFSNFETVIQNKLDTITDEKDILLIGKAIEATVGNVTITDIQDEGATQVGNVTTEGTTQVGNVTTEGTTQVGLVNTEGTTQVTNVQNEGTSQINTMTTTGDSYFPDRTGNAGKFLVTDGTSNSWSSVVENSSTAPSNPEAGLMWFDATNAVMKVWNGSKWEQMSNKFTASGGAESTAIVNGTTYRIHTFTTSGAFIVDAICDIDVLMVAGGGQGGGHACPGGGGAGGLIYKTNHTVTPGTYSIIVGAGGAKKNLGSSNFQAGNPGSDTTAFGMTADGGGAGVVWDAPSAASIAGGSAGGYGADSYVNSGFVAATQPTLSGDSGTFGFGNAGGYPASYHAPPYPGGGGGGAGAVGENAQGNSIAGRGGIGKEYDISGTATYYAGGGGGGGWAPVTRNTQPPGGGGIGDCGGNGNGTGTSGRGFSGYSEGEAGTANTGGGGGGAGRAGSEASYGGAGGSGIVIIRYTV